MHYLLVLFNKSKFSSDHFVLTIFIYIQFIKCISAGGRHSAAVTEEGELFTWGEGEHGRLGKQCNIPYFK